MGKCLFQFSNQDKISSIHVVCGLGSTSSKGTMAIVVDCPNCRATAQMPDSAAGGRGKCRSCGSVVVVPGDPAVKTCSMCSIDVTRSKRWKDASNYYYCDGCWNTRRTSVRVSDEASATASDVHSIAVGDYACCHCRRIFGAESVFDDDGEFICKECYGQRAAMENSAASAAGDDLGDLAAAIRARSHRDNAGRSATESSARTFTHCDACSMQFPSSLLTKLGRQNVCPACHTAKRKRRSHDNTALAEAGHALVMRGVRIAGLLIAAGVIAILGVMGIAQYRSDGFRQQVQPLAPSPAAGTAAQDLAATEMLVQTKFERFLDAAEQRGVALQAVERAKEDLDRAAKLAVEAYYSKGGRKAVEEAPIFVNAGKKHEEARNNLLTAASEHDAALAALDNCDLTVVERLATKAAEDSKTSAVRRDAAKFIASATMSQEIPSAALEAVRRTPPPVKSKTSIDDDPIVSAFVDRYPDLRSKVERRSTHDSQYVQSTLNMFVLSGKLSLSEAKHITEFMNQ